MKKILLVGAFVLSVVSFSNMHSNNNMGNMHNGMHRMGSGITGGKGIINLQSGY